MPRDRVCVDDRSSVAVRGRNEFVTDIDTTTNLASRLATSFDKLFRTSGKFQILKKLEKDFKAIEEKDDAKGQSVKPADLDGEKKARDLKASWEEQKGTHARIKDGKKLNFD